MVKEALGPHAEHLARAGFVVLAVDYRTVGSSEGQPRCQ
jgi:predicted alpha/beta hydrolase